MQLKLTLDKTEEKKSIDDFMLKRNDIDDFMLKRNGKLTVGYADGVHGLDGRRGIQISENL